MDSKALKPHVAIAGYALFMVINATQIWGGVFPFLPLDFQTPQVTLVFYLSQSLAFCATFIASAWGAYRAPARSRRMAVAFSCATVLLGSTCVIAAMYLTVATLALVVAGGVFLGCGCAGLFMLWQRYFSSVAADEGNFRLIAGTALASAAYFALYAIPVALTAFLVPLVFLPLCGLCLTLSVREMRFDQPMFEDVPFEHPRVYTRLLKDCWRSLVGIAALAFVGGLARGVAVVDVEVSGVVNTASMVGALLGSVALAACWMRASFRFSPQSFFRMVYPVMATGLVLFPFLQHDGLMLFAALGYLVFSLVILLMMMQCAQISRDRGTNPVFVYGLFGAVVYGAQSAGFLLGWFAYDIEVLGVGQTALLSIIAAWVLGMALFVAPGSVFRRVGAAEGRRFDQIEFLSPLVERRRGGVAAADGVRTGETGAGETQGLNGAPVGDALAAGLAGGGGSHAGDKPFAGLDTDGRVLVDRLSKQCLVLQMRYKLSSRETEVIELIARGRSVASIAEELCVSENTVRTHSKHIYTKLDIHSRRELGELLRELEG